ncbi:MAG: phosphotransferase [Mycobacteriales bacterium]
MSAFPVDMLFSTGHMSSVVGLRLDDGREVVLKMRRPLARIEACVGVHRHLWRAGFPCPEPLAGPEPLADLVATAEAYVPGGTQLPHAADAASRFSALLHRLITQAPSVQMLPSLEPAVPWVAWDHPGQELWPVPDDRGGDLNRVPGPVWIDKTAQEVRQFLREARLPLVVGHADFESQNIRWRGTEPLSVDDWDSVVAQPEAAIVGAAAAVWAARGGPGEASSVQETEHFIRGYVSASGHGRGRLWHRVTWAAGLWIRLYNAKKDAGAGGGPQLDLLARDYEERLRHVELGAA